MIERYIDSASTYAAQIDNVILLIAVLVGFWFVLIEMLFLGFIISFRAKPGVRAQYISGEQAHEKRWVTIPHYLVLVCDIFIIISAVQVWYHVKQELPPADRVVRIVGQQWAWSFVHPGPDGQIDTADDISTVDTLHLELGKTYHYKLTARDVMHSFSVPVFRLKQDAIPGREITGWFTPTRTGRYDIQCAEMCGIGHGLMPGEVIISSSKDHQAWMASAGSALAPGSAMAKGAE